MTVTQAIAEVRAAGSIHAAAGKLTVKFAPARLPELQPALDVLRRNRDQVLALVGQEFTLKGHAVELWCDGVGRLFIVADEEDAELAMQRYQATRGEVWTGPEIEIVARVADPETRREITSFKRTLSGTVASACRNTGVEHPPK
jgi:hypothetical protein